MESSRGPGDPAGVLEDLSICVTATVQVRTPALALS